MNIVEKDTSLEELLSILQGSTPQEVCNCFAYLFESKNLGLIEQGLDAAERISTEIFPDDVRCMFYYNLANGWNYKEQLTQSTPSFNSEYIAKQIYCTRLAIQYCDASSDFRKSQIWTNLGNLYSHLGRLTEAINAWDNATKYTPEFGMAIGNMGQCIYKYGGALFNHELRLIFLHTSYRLLKKAINSETSQPEAKAEYEKIVKSIESVNKPKGFLKEINYPNILCDEPEPQVQYWEWCISHKLVLNPLNDIIIHEAAAYDIIGLPKLFFEGKEYPQNKVDFYLSMFNEIKQQYASARYFVYKGTLRNDTHFSDKNNLLAMKTDYSNYSYNLELMKAGFKQCYSILDKIAFCIAEYLNLGIDKNRISFTSIWYDKKRVRQLFTDSNNPFFTALFWLSKDLKTKDGVLNPDAEAIADLRNFMEHKSLNIVDYADAIYNTEDGLTLIISRGDFEDKTISLLAIVRSAILYFLHGIHFAESQKERIDGLYAPMEYGALDDDCKR